MTLYRKREGLNAAWFNQAVEMRELIPVERCEHSHYDRHYFACEANEPFCAGHPCEGAGLVDSDE